MPSLKCLKISTARYGRPEFHIQPENVPVLRVLELTLMYPRMPTPLTSVTYLRYQLPRHAPWYCQAEMLSHLPSLLHLALNIEDTPDIQGMEPLVILPSLISLEVLWVRPRHIAGFQLFFRAFSLSRLQSLALHSEYYDRDYPSLLQLLVCVRSQKFLTGVLTRE
jgi:hypothetical protein